MKPTEMVLILMLCFMCNRRTTKYHCVGTEVGVGGMVEVGTVIEVWWAIRSKRWR